MKETRKPDPAKSRPRKAREKPPTVDATASEDSTATIEPDPDGKPGEANVEANKYSRPGNTNAMKHGISERGRFNANRHGLKAGKLPKDAKYIEVRLNIFRRELEAAVLSAKDEINIADAASVQTCIRWERHAMLAQRWLTKQYDELKPADRLNFSREIARASGERDKAIKALCLDSHAADDVIIKLYGPGKTG